MLITIEEAIRQFDSIFCLGNRIKPAAVIGGSASGKSYFCQLVADRFPGQILLFPMDPYYKGKRFVRVHDGVFFQDVIPGIPFLDRSVAGNFDDPRSVDLPLITDHINELLRSGSVVTPMYDMPRSCRSPETKLIKRDGEKVLLYDGLFLPPDFFPDIVFIDASPHSRLIRRLMRDPIRKNISAGKYDQFMTFTLFYMLGTVFPMHMCHVEPIRDRADYVIYNEYDTEFEFAGVTHPPLEGKIERRYYFPGRFRESIEILYSGGQYWFDYKLESIDLLLNRCN